MKIDNLVLAYPWEMIETCLDSMVNVNGGFSLAKRGLVTMPDGKTIFVKIGAEENSAGWAKKELAVYRYLSRQSFPFVPKVLSKNNDETAFALEALLPEDGWDWSDTWTLERLDATLKSMDRLALLDAHDQDWATEGKQALDTTYSGWQALLDSPELQDRLRIKLKNAGHTELATTLNIKQEAMQSSRYIFRSDALVHYDVRSDNCAWNTVTKEVRLIDWNWAQLGDTRIDMAATLVNAQRGGDLDVLTSHTDRLDAGALQWLAGFWLRGAATPIWDGGSETLRDHQLASGVESLRLAKQAEK